MSSHVTQQQAALSQTEQELERLRHEQSALQASLQHHEERGLKASEPEKVHSSANELLGRKEASG